MLTAYCFYLPLGIMGPLITSKTFKECMSKDAPPLGFKLLFDALFGVARYMLWMCITDMSTYFVFQQAFTYHVRNKTFITHLLQIVRCITVRSLFLEGRAHSAVQTLLTAVL